MGAGSISPNVCGAALIKTGTGSAGALESLGYTANGAEISENQYYGDIHGDQNGGDEGPPIDIQIFGETHLIRIDLTSYDETVADNIRKMGGTLGTPLTSGGLMFTGSLAVRLVILTTTYPRNYPRVVFRGAKEVNKGTKFSRLRLEATAYKDGNGVLWNTTTS